MKHIKILTVLVMSLMIFGCVQSDPDKPSTTVPSTTIAATPTPSPSPILTPEPMVGEIIKQAQANVPLSSVFLANIAGVTPKAPSEYSLESNGSFSLSLSLQTFSQLNFLEKDSTQTLKRIATAPHFRKSVSVSASSFQVTWVGQDKEFADQDVLEAKLLKNGASSVCVTPKGQEKDCIIPSKEQVSQLWKALSGNALDDAIQLVLPDASLKSLLKVEKTQESTYAGRPCTGYNLALTEEALYKLNQIGGAAVSDLKGSICLDKEFGFPLKTDLKSSLSSISEEVIEFQSGSYVRMKSCTTRFQIKFNVKNPRPVFCNRHIRNEEDDSEAVIAGNGGATFVLPPGSRNAKVYVSGYRGPAQCSIVRVNGVTIYDKSQETVDIDRTYGTYCTMQQSKRNVCSPLVGNDEQTEVSKGVPINGREFSIAHEFKVFYMGGRPAKASLTIIGDVSYEAPVCAAPFNYQA